MSLDSTVEIIYQTIELWYRITTARSRTFRLFGSMSDQVKHASQWQYTYRTLWCIKRYFG